MFTYLYLTPLGWHQEIRSYPSLSFGDEGGYLTTRCSVKQKCSLQLPNGAKIQDFDVHLSILHGALPADKIAKRHLLKDAIGGLFFVEEQSFVHGSVYLDSRNYEGLWEQVRTGGYGSCTISLAVEPLEDDVWKDGPLSITSASFAFGRPVPAQQDKPADRRAAPSHVEGVWKAARAIKGAVAFVCFAVGWAFAMGAVNALVHPSSSGENPFDVALPTMFAAAFLLGSLQLLRRKA